MATNMMVGIFPTSIWNEIVHHLLIDFPVKVLPEGRARTRQISSRLQQNRTGDAADDDVYQRKEAPFLGLTLSNQELNRLVEGQLYSKLTVHYEKHDALIVRHGTRPRDHTTKVRIVASSLEFAVELCNAKEGVRSIFPQLERFVLKERANPNHYDISMVSKEHSNLAVLKRVREILLAEGVMFEAYLDFSCKHGFTMGWINVCIRIDPTGRAILCETWKTSEADFDKLKATFDTVWGGSLYKPPIAFFREKLEWPNPDSDFNVEFDGPWFEPKAQRKPSEAGWLFKPLVVIDPGAISGEDQSSKQGDDLPRAPGPERKRHIIESESTIVVSRIATAPQNDLGKGQRIDEAESPSVRASKRKQASVDSLKYKQDSPGSTRASKRRWKTAEDIDDRAETEATFKVEEQAPHDGTPAKPQKQPTRRPQTSSSKGKRKRAVQEETDNDEGFETATNRHSKRQRTTKDDIKASSQSDNSKMPVDAEDTEQDAPDTTLVSTMTKELRQLKSYNKPGRREADYISDVDRHEDG